MKEPTKIIGPELINCPGLPPFIIIRIGDWVHLFDVNGGRIGNWFAPQTVKK